MSTPAPTIHHVAGFDFGIRRWPSGIITIHVSTIETGLIGVVHSPPGLDLSDRSNDVLAARSLSELITIKNPFTKHMDNLRGELRSRAEMGDTDAGLLLRLEEALTRERIAEFMVEITRRLDPRLLSVVEPVARRMGARPQVEVKEGW